MTFSQLLLLFHKHAHDSNLSQNLTATQLIPLPHILAAVYKVFLFLETLFLHSFPNKLFNFVTRREAVLIKTSVRVG